MDTYTTCNGVLCIPSDSNIFAFVNMGLQASLCVPQRMFESADASWGLSALSKSAGGPVIATIHTIEKTCLIDLMVAADGGRSDLTRLSQDPESGPSYQVVGQAATYAQASGALRAWIERQYGPTALYEEVVVFHLAGLTPRLSDMLGLEA